MTTIADATARTLHGRLWLRFARTEGRTVLAAAERTPPLQLQRLLYLDRSHPGLARAVLLNGVAGLFAGDRLETEIEVDTGAAVEVGTPAMSRVFAMPSGHAEAATRLSVAPGGYLEYLPEPVLLCAGAALRASLAIDAAAGSVVAAGEVLAFGRVARGELHAYRDLESRTTVRVDGAVVLADRLALDPALGDAATAVGGFAASGCLLLLCLNPEQMLASVRTVLAAGSAMAAVATLPPAGVDTLAAATLLPAGAGVAVRVLGASPHGVHAALRAVLARFRREAWPPSPGAPRSNRPE